MLKYTDANTPHDPLGQMSSNVSKNGDICFLKHYN